MFLALPSNPLPIVSKNDDAAKVRNFWVMACEVRGNSAQRWRVARNGGVASGIIGGSAAGGGGMVRRDRKKRLWAAGWDVPLPEPFPPPPISPCSLRLASPFRCERSEQAEPLASLAGPHQLRTP